MSVRSKPGAHGHRRVSPAGRPTRPRLWAQISDGSILDRMSDRVRRHAPQGNHLAGHLAQRRQAGAPPSAPAPVQGVVPPALLDGAGPAVIHLDASDPWADDDTELDITLQVSPRGLPSPYPRDPRVPGQSPRRVNARRWRRVAADRAGWIAFAAALAVLVSVLALNDRPLERPLLPTFGTNLARASGQIGSFPVPVAGATRSSAEAAPNGGATPVPYPGVPTVESLLPAANTADHAPVSKVDQRGVSRLGRSPRRSLRSDQGTARTPAGALLDHSHELRDDDEVLPLDLEGGTIARSKGAPSRPSPASPQRSLGAAMPRTLRQIDFDDPFRRP